MRTITAMYDSRADAEEVVERLVSAGVARQDISMVQQDATTAATTATTERESGGFLDSLANLFLPDDDRSAYTEGVRRGAVLLSARVDDDRVDEAIDVLERSSAVDVDSRAEEWRSSGWTGGMASTAAGAATGYGAGLREDTSRTTSTAGYEAGTTTSTASRDYGTGGSGRGIGERAGDALSDAAEAVGLKSDDHDETTRRAYGSTTSTSTAGYADTAGMGAARVRDDGVVERAEERLVVGKREVGRGSVRVRSYVVETPVEEQVTLRDERVEVERRAVDRPVQAGDDVFREKVIEASERIEEAVIGKEARVVEEIGLRKEGGQRTETVRDTVRRQEVEVEDARSTGRAATTGLVETDRVSSADVDLDDTTTTTTTTSTSRTGGL